jgi:hypothetical protein
MIHLANITWAQLFLIGVGAVLQFIAVCAFFRETSAFRARTRPRKEDVGAQEQGLEFRSSVKAETARAGNAGRKTKAVDLTKTTNAKFVQSFKFLPDSHYSRRKASQGQNG